MSIPQSPKSNVVSSSPVFPKSGRCFALAALLAIAFSGFLISPLAAQNSTWNTNSDVKFATSSAWDPAAVPGTNANLFFIAGYTGDVRLEDAEITVASITKESGTEQLFHARALSSTLTTTGNLTISGGTGLAIRNNPTNLSWLTSVDIEGDVVVSGGYLQFGKSSEGSSLGGSIENVSVGGTTSIASSRTLSFGQIRGTATLGNLVMNGGTLDLISGVSTGTGTVNGGSNTVTVNRLHGATGTIRGNKTATLETTGNLVVDGSVDGTYGGTIINNAANNVISLTKSGESVLTLSGTNTYTGGTTINGGVLSVASAASLPGWDQSGDYSVAAGSALAVGNSFTDANVATILGTTNFAAGAGIGFDTTDGNREYADDITGDRALVKVGENALTVSGNNTYSAGTTISHGTLIVGTSVGSGIVSLRGALEAGLQINAGVSVENDIVFSNTNADSLVSRIVNNTVAFTTGTDGELRSDFAEGIDTIASILEGENTLGGDTTLDMSFSSLSPALNDIIRMSDVFSLTGTNADVFVLQLNVTGLDPTATLGWLNGSNVWVNAITGNTETGSLGGTFYALSFSQFLTDYNMGNFDPVSMLGAYGNDGSGNVWAVLDHNSDFAAIPEPRVWALAGIGMATILMRLRRRR